VTPLTTVAFVLFGLAGLGLLLVGAQCVALLSHLRQASPLPTRYPGISVLKPLCGVDDDLLANLEVFTRLRYPNYEVLLGIRDTSDPAYPVARWAEQQWPSVMRVVIQRGEPGLNPKVNQLITLAAAARHDILVVNDSNVRVRRNYLSEIAAYFENPRVGLVTHPLAGGGEQRLGALLDNLYLSTHIGPGVVAAKQILRKDFVVSKSMALRREDLRAMGGFEAVKDVLAEDYVTGRLVSKKLGKKIVIARNPITNVSRYRRVSEFVARYARWGVMQRRVVGVPIYTAELLLNPILLASFGLALMRDPLGLALWSICCGLKALVDCVAAQGLRGGPFPWRLIPFVPLKDLLASASWAHGLVISTVNWRGNRLLVQKDTKLELASGNWGPAMAVKASPGTQPPVAEARLR
jgi:ceramide glucosyltransferase